MTYWHHFRLLTLSVWIWCNLVLFRIKRLVLGFNVFIVSPDVVKFFDALQLNVSDGIHINLFSAERALASLIYASVVCEEAFNTFLMEEVVDVAPQNLYLARTFKFIEAKGAFISIRKSHRFLEGTDF